MLFELRRSSTRCGATTFCLFWAFCSSAFSFYGDATTFRFFLKNCSSMLLLLAIFGGIVVAFHIFSRCATTIKRFFKKCSSAPPPPATHLHSTSPCAILNLPNKIEKDTSMLKFLMYIKKSNGAPVTLYATQDMFVQRFDA